MKVYYKKILFTLLVAFLLIVTVLTNFSTRKYEAANPDPFFSISILVPNTNPARNQ